jgi:CheY-like chemotaxis protein
MPKTLLLADDSVTIQRVIELTFSQEDVRVVSVSDGQRAVEWLETGMPDIVLVDVDVPGINGYEVAARVKQSPRLRHVPVVLLAGAFEPVDQERVRSIPCDGVLVKPFEPQRLVSRVKELLAQTPTAIASGSRSASAFGAGTGNQESAPVALFPRAAESYNAFRGSPMSALDDMTGAPETLEPPDRNVWEHRDGPPVPPVPPAPIRAADPYPSPPQPKVSLVNAFSALLAAEQSNPSAQPQPVATAPTDASVEDAVRRVLVRMTDELVRRIVVETAERLIKEEIEKIKGNPE